MLPLNGFFSVEELREAGYPAYAFQKEGFSAGRLLNAGFPREEVRKAGYSAAELYRVGYCLKGLVPHFSAYSLRVAGFRLSELIAEGVSVANLRKAGYLPRELERAGCSLSDIAAIAKQEAQLSSGTYSFPAYGVNEFHALGCAADVLIEGGFSARDIKEAGYPLQDFQWAFTPAQLRAAGVGSSDLLKAGFSREQLIEAGYPRTEVEGIMSKVTRIRRCVARDSFKLADHDARLSELREAGLVEPIPPRRTPLCIE